MVTELARGHHLPFQVSESVADLYRQALRRYGPADGELLGIALLEEQAWPLGYGIRQPRTDQMIHNASRPESECAKRAGRRRGWDAECPAAAPGRYLRGAPGAPPRPRWLNYTWVNIDAWIQEQGDMTELTPDSSR